MTDAQRDHIVEELRTWLGEDGIAFFSEMLEEHGTVSAVFPVPYGDTRYGPQKFFPHSVHSMEGMQVRNFLRTLPQTKEWDAHDFDNHWAALVTEVLQGKQPGEGGGGAALQNGESTDGGTNTGSASGRVSGS